MSDRYASGEWWIDYPWRALAFLAGPAIIAGLAGVGLDALLDAKHAISPDNIFAGSALGCGSVILGFIAGGIAVGMMNRRYRRR